MAHPDRDLDEVVLGALRELSDKPTPLIAAIEKTAEIKDIEFPDPSGWLNSRVTTWDENDPVCHKLGLAIRGWDSVKDRPWLEATDPHSAERRNLIYKRLDLQPKLSGRIGESVPLYTASELPLVIAEKHVPWYVGARRTDRFYWGAYADYLRERRGMKGEAIEKLDIATDSVVERLSDPTRQEAFAARGLIVGYVQSGKTTHFTGVLAKAADAGYRLIIVLAGTLNILRAQTQRRLDKELLGRELVDGEYLDDADWDDFISHGGRPSDLEAFDWVRLTGSEDDYQHLKHGIRALEFERRVKERPLFDAANLQHAAVRLVVIKKIPKVIEKLAKDLGRIRGKLNEVPALVVDDESDQASINTINPNKPVKDNKVRTATNHQIVKLLEALPRAQYLGYTATPFANVLINRKDKQDLFPRHFIVSLPRPVGYMGVADFYDLGEVPSGYKSNERAFVRSVEGENEQLENLPRALDSFILAGAIKLYREDRDPATYRFQHHTMLIHYSAFIKIHEAQRNEVKRLLEDADYFGSSGARRLEALLDAEFRPISKAQAPDSPFPASFKALTPFVAECLRRLDAVQAIRIVNGDNKDDTPDFNKGPIWAILIGGAKLSRGYTVEGLTTTYFRRVSKTTDTLMQMGRWFGYRAGYRDLVRLFIGRDEELSVGKERLDLYEAFKALCLDEEEFRNEIAKYRDDPEMTPEQVPPLVPSHLEALLPVARNKMHYAEKVFQNFSGDYIERTVAPADKNAAGRNSKRAAALVEADATQAGKFSYKDDEGRIQKVSALFGVRAHKDVLAFLETYEWQTPLSALAHELKFLKGGSADPEIHDWLVFAPQLQEKTAATWPDIKGFSPTFTVKERARIGERFKVYSESTHVNIAKHIAGCKTLADPNPLLAQLTKKKGRAVLLCYPVTNEKDAYVTVGFALQLPVNSVVGERKWVTR